MGLMKTQTLHYKLDGRHVACITDNEIMKNTKYVIAFEPMSSLQHHMVKLATG